ncbi:sulfur carrier protein ThiS [Ectopseudomonas oleovorans]|jgi:sulfur carrier protein|uniref:sulfur carrier protein ThiS n=1 Tax=Ectopseudomonas oleovorans TaxID=301 RepID=UPI00244BDF40|nr:sulfur carrier protein ThiS [Pseudomonas oleovorans]MDH2197849.1 sulfur carrier protein ThiS [Pseudomonas oleovorans]
MQIQLNGEAYDLERPVTLAELLEQLELAGKRLAIEHNLNIVPRSQYAETTLQAGDRVEIVHAIGGG